MITFTQLGKMGRLGNQLFQLATTIALAERNNDSYVFPPWEYEEDFNLHNCFSKSIQPKHTFKESGFIYRPIPYQPDTDLFGFFQSEKYFADCSSTIMSLLTPKVGYGIKYGYTSIHVRRGDYVNLKNAYAQLDMKYYQAAMNQTKTQFYMIFSDDIAWCKHQFIGTQFIFAEGNSPVTDLALQLSCEHNIIANSSFSWWGAYLNKNPAKRVIAPGKWFGPAQPHDTRDLLPSSWTII